jgi:hypothetical protein
MPNAKIMEASFHSNIARAAGGPGGLDKALRDAGLTPLLINPYLATLCDLHSIGLGICVNIPIHIGPGGRKSLYELDVNEKVLAYLLTSDQDGVLFRYMTRLTGNGPVQSGDVFRQEITNTNGDLIFATDGEIEIQDPSIGKGIFKPSSTATDKPQTKATVWILWSCINVCQN